MLKKKKVHYSFIQILSFITSNWLILSAIVIYIGCLYYNISPSYYFEKLELQQQQALS